MDSNQAKCARVIERCLDLSDSDELRVNVSLEESSHLRFARNTITTSAVVENLSVSVRSSFGAKSASLTSNRTDPDSLKRLVQRAERAARLMPEDPEAMGELGQSPRKRTPATELEKPAESQISMARGAAHCIRAASDAGLLAAGFVQVQNGTRAMGTTAGLSASHQLKEAHFSTTVRTPDGTGSGWSSCAAPSAWGLDFENSARVAIEKARSSARPSALRPGTLPTILEPACVASLLRLLLGGMQARSFDEGRSAFSEKQAGARVFPSLVNVRSDPFDLTVPVQHWSAEGLPHRTHEWIRAGSLGEFACDRYWAKKSGRRPLPEAPNAIMLGGQKTLEELIASTEKALLVTNLWYMRQVDPRSMLYTGLTRDGVFVVENGEVVRPVNNFRWNDSPIRVFQQIEELSRSERVGGRGGVSKNFVVPAVKLGSFRFSSVSEAV